MGNSWILDFTHSCGVLFPAPPLCHHALRPVGWGWPHPPCHLTWANSSLNCTIYEKSWMVVTTGPHMALLSLWDLDHFSSHASQVSPPGLLWVFFCFFKRTSQSTPRQDSSKKLLLSIFLVLTKYTLGNENFKWHCYDSYRSFAFSFKIHGILKLKIYVNM